MQMFMIACHMDSKKNVIAFRIIDTDTGECKDYNYNQVKSVLEQGIKIDGIKLENGMLKGSNGVFERYTQLINGITIGKCPIVIVKEYPYNTYDVCNHLGQIAHMSIMDIIQFADVEGLANGKIINTEKGYRIQSICGEYPKDKSFKDIEYGDILKAKMACLGVDSYKLDDNNLLFGKQDTNEEIAVGKGCVGVKDNAFKNFKNIKKVVLPATCISFGIQSFFNCTSLESINIPEGTKVIPRGCFAGCTSLEAIVLPNSIRKIEAGAFKDCNKLKEVSLGPVKPEISSLSFPRNTKLKVRR